MKYNYLKLPLDLNKRHFAVGDLHGKHDQFLTLLEMIEYNKETDIIYSVGDMIDRGPQSVEVLMFFSDNKNCYAIKGNHEVMAIYDTWMSVWLANGGMQCLASLKTNKLDEKWLRRTIKKFPNYIDVGTDEDEGCFRIIHAEMPPEWSEAEFQRVVKEKDSYGVEALLWSRKTITVGLNNVGKMKLINDGIEFNEERSGRQIFCGHTPTERIVKIGDMTYIDTFGSDTLSMINTITREQFTTKVYED